MCMFWNYWLSSSCLRQDCLILWLKNKETSAHLRQKRPKAKTLAFVAQRAQRLRVQFLAFLLISRIVRFCCICFEFHRIFSDSEPQNAKWTWWDANEIYWPRIMKPMCGRVQEHHLLPSTHKVYSRFPLNTCVKGRAAGKEGGKKRSLPGGNQ